MTSVVSFCELRLQTEQVKQIIEEGKSIDLSTATAVEQELSEGNYIAVLKAVWSERNRSRRLEWLQKHAPELHAPLMYEQAIAEFLQNPCIHTIVHVSLPLIKAAEFRLMQDGICSSDASVYNGDAHVRMQNTYRMSLSVQVERFLHLKLDAIISQNGQEITAAVRAKMQEIAAQSLSHQLPKPDWIGWHGMSVFLSGGISMHPAAEYKTRRDDYARKFILHLNKMPASLVSAFREYFKDTQHGKLFDNLKHFFYTRPFVNVYCLVFESGPLYFEISPILSQQVATTAFKGDTLTSHELELLAEIRRQLDAYKQIQIDFPREEEQTILTTLSSILGFHHAFEVAPFREGLIRYAVNILLPS